MKTNSTAFYSAITALSRQYSMQLDCDLSTAFRIIDYKLEFTKEIPEHIKKNVQNAFDYEYLVFD